MKRCALFCACLPAVLAAALLLPSPAAARLVSIPLQPGWNMISFPFEPDDSSVASVVASLSQPGTFQSLWAYDAGSGTWSRFPTPAAEVPALSRVEVGRGYWIRVNQAVTLNVTGTGQMDVPSAPMQLNAGWNLVGFPLQNTEAVDRVIKGLPVRSAFRFEPNGMFQGLQVSEMGAIDSSAAPSFQRFEPGRGYWLLLRDSAVVAPLLGTSLPGDTDVAPLLPEPVVQGVPVRYSMETPLTPGDVDVGLDGFFDGPTTQRAIEIGELQSFQRITVFNAGTGVLGFTAVVDNPTQTPWLRLREARPLGETGPLVTELGGMVFTESMPIDIAVDRAGLTAGRLTGSITIFSNGVGVDASGVPDSSRTLKVALTVPPLDGDYRLSVDIQTLDGRPAALPDPTVVLSLYEDKGSLKAAIDDSRTALFPQKVRMIGRQFEPGTDRFALSGSIEVGPGGLNGVRDPSDPTPFNPFLVSVRRDVSLIAARPNTGQGTPLGLVGEYRETIRNVLGFAPGFGQAGTPVVLAGRFTATRLSPTATAQDRTQASLPTNASLRDLGTTTLTVNVPGKLRITDVDVELDIIHPRAADLRVSLTSPKGTTQVLLEDNPNASRRLLFDAVDTPVGDLSLFDGEMSNGTWTLNVQDVAAGEAGTLNSFRLLINGTEVRTVSGPLTAPAGTLVVLSGCGDTRSFVSTAANQTYRFDEVLDCVYTVTAFTTGRVPVSQEVVVSGNDVTVAAALAPSMTAPPAPSVVPVSTGPNLVLAFAGTTFSSGSVDPRFGGENAFDAATFDLNRAPTATTLPGREDTDAFNALEDPLRRSNVRSDPPNGMIDPPIGARSFRVAAAVAAPLQGASVSGDVRLASVAAVLSEGRR
jgi:subtilisin-like proprotein convertase family protein